MSEIQNHNNEDVANTAKQELDNQKIIDFIDTIEGGNITQEHQRKLDQINTILTEKVTDNNNQTRDKINIDFSVVYGIENARPADVSIEKWQGFKGNLSNTENYISSTILDGTERVNNSDYWDYWYDLLDQYHDGKIDYNELWELDRVPYSDYLNGEYGNEQMFITHEQRNLSEHEENLLDAIHDPRTEYDLLGYLLSSLDNANPEDYKGISPLDVLQERYENASDADKIELAKTMSRYMSDYGYDYSLPNGDVSSEDMWAAYREGGVAGVCRHHHSEVAKFLASVGIQSGVITTNSGGRHAITWGKQEDGTFFMIDYGSYYEGDDPKELQARYLAEKGAIDLKEVITDENDKVIGTLQTQLEELFQDATSSIGTGDSLAYSQYLGQEGNNINEGIHIGLQKGLNGAGDAFNASYGIQSGNLSAEAGVFHNKNRDVDYADFTSTGGRIRVQLGDEANKLGKIATGAQLSKNEFEWENGKKRENIVLGGHVAYTNDVFSNDSTKVSIASVTQGQIMKDLQNAKEDGDGGIEDGFGSTGATINVQQKLSKNWTLNGGISGGGDIGYKHVRDSGIEEGQGIIKSVKSGIGQVGFYENAAVFGGASYSNDNLTASLNASHERGLGYNSTRADLNISTGKVEVGAGIESVDNLKNSFLLSEKAISAKMIYNATDALSFSLEGESWSNGPSDRKEIQATARFRF